MEPRTPRLKILTLLTTGLVKADIALEERDLSPRLSAYERYLSSDMLFEDAIEQAPPLWRMIYRRLPITIAEALEAFRIRKRYDVIISWSDPHAFALAAILKITRSRTPHLALLAWISKPKKARILRLIHSHITRMVFWTSAHLEFARDRLGIPEERMRFIPYFVDQQFWRPIHREENLICSAGVEMRDYPTLIEAIRGTDIPCHIAAGIARGKLFDTVTAIDKVQELPKNLTVGRLSSVELREMYSRSRFVVVPLRPSDSDNGLTVILEAMAMEKAVICSRIQGQRDVIIEGVTGLFVPQGDPVALREAILYLWNNPAAAEAMGKAGRKRVEEHFTLEQFVEAVYRNAAEIARPQNGKSGRKA